MKLEFALVGVGGQGIVLASEILAAVGLAAGYDVKKTDSLGMSQRGGSVVSFVRWGERVHAPLPGTGECDIVVALEKLEAARGAPLVRAGGLVVVNDHAIRPPTVRSGAERYPTDDEVRHLFLARTLAMHFVDGPRLADELGNPRVVNVVLLGFVAASLPLPIELWQETLASMLPERIRQVNLRALERGRQEWEGRAGVLG
jgi:indolepyruvate ferredoxin oxidoreductase, beta subunit